MIQIRTSAGWSVKGRLKFVSVMFFRGMHCIDASNNGNIVYCYHLCCSEDVKGVDEVVLEDERVKSGRGKSFLSRVEHSLGPEPNHRVKNTVA